MRLILKYIIILLMCTNLFSQETHTHGEVFNLGVKIKNVHLKNLSSGEMTTTNDEGFFKIKTHVGDSIFFSHVGMKDLFLVIKNANSSDVPIRVDMVYARIELNEVFLYKPPVISAVSLGIISKEIKKLTPAERKLYTARSGVLDPIINALSGRTKKLKKTLELEGQLTDFEFLKENYSTYLLEELNLSEEVIEMYFNYLVDENDLHVILKNNNKQKINFYILNNWFKFKKTNQFIKYSKKGL